MKLDEGKSAVKTMCGSICSFILLVVLVAYSAQKLDILINRKNVDILSSLLHMNLSQDDIFGY